MNQKATRITNRLAAALFALALIVASPSAFAACSSPAGNAGDIVFSSTSGIMVYCNGTAWINMGASSAVSFGTLTTGDFCTATGGSTISCTTATVNMGTQVTGTLGVGNGGTGLTGITTNGIIYGQGSSTPIVTAAGSQYNVFVAGSSGVPGFGQVNLAQSAAVTGILPAANGGTGVNNSNTITLGGNINTAGALTTAGAFTTSGAFSLTLTTTGITNVTLPTSGTLVNTGVTTLSSLASIGTITTGVWNGTPVATTYGGLGGNFGSSTGALSINAGTVTAGTLSVGNGGTGATAFTQGSAVFAGASGVYTQDNSNFFYDATNHRLGLGNATPGATLTVKGTEALSFGTDYSTATANQADVALNTSSSFRYTGASNASFAGIVAGTGGQLLTLINATANVLTLNNQDTGNESTVANRIITGTGANMNMPANTSVTLQYDGTAARWRVIGASTAAVAQAAGANTQVQYNNSGSMAGDASFTYITPGALTLGAASGSTGSLALAGTTSGAVTIQPQAAAGTYNFNLPTGAGSAGQPLLSGAGGSSPMTFGTLGVAGGGTALTSITTNGIIYGQGTGTPVVTSAGSQYNVFVAGASGVPTFGQVNLAQAAAVTGTLPLGNGGTGQTTAPLARASSGLDIDQMTTHGDSAYAILATDRTVTTSASLSAARTWTLPAASAVNAGQQLCVADQAGGVTGANTLTIARAGSDTINGATSYVLNAAYQGVCLVSDGSSQWTLAAAAGAPVGTSSITGIVSPANGGTGVNNSNTITLGGNINTAGAFTTSGAFALTLTTTGATNVTLPTSGTLVNTGVTTLSSLASVGTITTGVWNGTMIGVGYGGTGTATAFTQGSAVFAGASGVYTQDNSNFFYDATNHRLGLGNATPGATLTVKGTEALSFGTDYSTATANQADVALNTSSSFRYTGASNASFAGIVAGTGGQLLTLINATANVLTLNNQDTGNESTVANRIITGTGANMNMPANTSVILQYDGTAARWRVIGASTAAVAQAAGANTQVQYNNSGVMAGSSGLVYDYTNSFVGVGTSPSAIMHISGSGNTSGDLLAITPAASNSSTSAVNIDKYGDVYFGSYAIGIGYDGNVSHQAVSGANGPLYLTSDTSTSGNDNIYILPHGTGKVGIGTATLSQFLTVNGNADVMGAGNGYLTEIANDTSTGTTVNLLAKLNGAGTKVILPLTTDTDGMVGVVVGGAGTSGNAQIAIEGQASCVFDNATAAGDYATISTITAGQCHDVGATRSSTSQTVGRLLVTNASSGGTNAMMVMRSSSPAASGAPTGTGTTNYAAIWKSATTLGTGILVDVGTAVGIGTTSPDAALVIDGGGSNSLVFRDNSIENHKVNGNASVVLNFYGYNGATSQYRDFQVYNGKTGAIATFVGSTGNVGIGTTTPQGPLQIGLWNIFGNHSTANDNYALSTYGTNLWWNGTNWVTTNDGFNNGASMIGQSILGDIQFFALPTTGGTNQTITDANIENYARMTIKGNGSIGIGTATVSSSNILEVNGAATIGYTNTAAPSNGAIIKGSVGIGTSSASYPLDVVSTTGDAEGAIESLGSSGSAAYLHMNYHNAAYYGIRFEHDSATDWWLGNWGGASDSMTFYRSNNTTPVLSMQPGGTVGIGTTTAGATLTIKGSEALMFGTDYSTATANQADVALNTSSSFRYTGASNASFAGIVAGTGGQLLTLINATANVLTLNNQDTGNESTVANRIITGTGANMNMPANTSVTLQYDGTAARWRVIGASTAAVAQAAGANTQVQYNNSGSMAGDASFTYITPGALTLGASSGSTGSLALAGTTSGTVTVQPQAAAGTYNFNLPTGAGSAGQPLLSGAGGSSPMTFGTLGVAGGGTALTSITTNGIIYGQGSSTPIVTSAGSQYNVFVAGASGVPTFGQVNLAQSAAVTGILPAANGGTGVNNSNTITLGGNINTAGAFTTSGAFALTLTTTGITNVTLPTSGTLVNTGVTTLSSLASIGTITTGVWNGTPVAITYGGTGQATAPLARASSGLDIDQMTTHGDSAYAILATDRTVTTSASLSAARTWTLPAASAVNAGQQLCVADQAGGVTGANTLTIARAGSDTINGATSYVLNAAYQGVCLVSDGSSQWTLAAAAGAPVGTSSITGVLSPANGGTGVNNGTNTITLGSSFTTSGANSLTLTTTASTNVTLPTTGTLVNTGVTTLSSLASIGTITTGVWNGTMIGVGYGGTGTATAFTQGSAIFAGASGVYTQDNANFFYDATNHRLGIGNATPGATLTVNGAEALMFGTDYSTIGAQSDVSINTTSAVRYTGAGPATFRGIVAGTGGQILTLHNASGNILTIANENSSESTVANRIITGTGSDIALPTNNSIVMQYDGTTSRWRVTGSSYSNAAAVAAIGTDTQISYNASGVMSGSNSLVYDYTNTRLGIGTTTPGATLALNGTAALMFGANYATTGLQSDVAINAASAVRYTGSGTATFYGIVAGTTGQILVLHNASSNILTIANESGSETTVANRIVTGGGDLAMPVNSAISLQYDGTTSRWRVTGNSTPPASPGGSNTQVQYNNAGVMAGDSLMTWDNTNKLLAVGAGAPTPVATTGTVAGLTVNVIPQAMTLTTTAGGTGGTTIANGAAGQMAYYNGTSSIAATSNLNVVGSNIGIGTSAATNLLSLDGTAARTMWMERGTTVGNNLTLQAGGGLSGGTNENGGNLILSSGITTGTGTSKMQFNVYPGVAGATADNTATTAMTILSSGNVGIGTTGPTAVLDVSVNASGGNGPEILVENLAGTTPGTFGPGVILNNHVASTHAFIINQFQDANSNFNIADFASPFTQYFIINQSGKVGIGSTNPANALDVNGTVAATTFSGSGASLTSLNASNLSSGTVPTARLGSGTANSSTYLRGDQTWNTPSTLVTVSIQSFTSSGTYTPHAGLIYAVIECVGGGGAGGGAVAVSGHTRAAGGGQSGAYSRKTASAAAIGASQTVTIGTAGTAGTAGAHNGNNGGTTSVGSLCTAPGGAGGTFSDESTGWAQGGASSSVGTGDVVFPGNQGGQGVFGTIVTLGTPSGYGAPSYFGGGASGVSNTNTDEAGTAGIGYGSGGSGADCSGSTTSEAGGAGTAGIVVITEYSSQ